MAIFKSKAENLQELQGTLVNADLLPQFYFKVIEWEQNKKFILEKIFSEEWSNDSLVVRSSALSEDSNQKSLAGCFTSILDIKNRSKLEDAVNMVIKSYSHPKKNDIVLVQPFLKNVYLSGVAFSKNPSNGANYTIINYDDSSGLTDTVTSGVSNFIKTFCFYNDSKLLNTNKFYSILKLLDELKNKFSSDSLDIEFAIDNKKKIYLLQVRPLLILNDLKNISDDLVLNCLKNISDKFKKLSSSNPFLYGKKSIFGLMPDWNPAEIIGIKPNNLALSLYKELITDSIWAYQRNNYGYKNLRSFPLLINFGGMPYIDVRVSFNSFIPSGIDNKLSEKLVNYYLNKLENYPQLHDKVEFDIAFSCYTFDIEDRIKTLLNYDFKEKEIKTLTKELKKLTNKIINSEYGLWKNDIKKIEILDKRREMINSSKMENLQKIYWLIEDCKRYGTLPFAGLARAAFIAMQILKSLVNLNIFSENDFNYFLYSIHTVNSELIEDFEHLDIISFLKKYGHLRPGTYDIMQPRYDEKPNRYFIFDKKRKSKKEKKSVFKLSKKQYSQIKKLLRIHNIDSQVDELFIFIKGAIEARENAKFKFSKNLSDCMQLIEEYGKEELRIDKQELAHLDIKDLLSIYSKSNFSKDNLLNQVQVAKNNFAVTEKIALPRLIIDEQDIWSFEINYSEPNFITNKIVEGEVVIDLEKNLKDLKGKILFITSADPGFDWIFPHQIAAFITVYGGSNSHMAIRAGELGIPAVIGAGDNLFNYWKKARKLEINCISKKVSILG